MTGYRVLWHYLYPRKVDVGTYMYIYKIYIKERLGAVFLLSDTHTGRRWRNARDAVITINNSSVSYVCCLFLRCSRSRSSIIFVSLHHLLLLSATSSHSCTLCTYTQTLADIHTHKGFNRVTSCAGAAYDPFIRSCVSCAFDNTNLWLP